MAKVDKNIVIQGLSGSLRDRLVIQTSWGGQTIIRPKSYSNGKETDTGQPAGRARAQETTLFTEEGRGDSDGTPQAVYNVMKADCFHPLEVITIDVESWNGRMGETLQARLRENARVEQIHFLIAQEDGTLVEEGPGKPIGDSLWWEYVTTVDHPGAAAKILVITHELPDHEASLEAKVDAI